MLNLAVMLEDSARSHPDREAVVYGSVRLSYGILDLWARQIAGLLAERGVQRGDTVALACPNLPYFPAVYFGILKAGATVVPINVLLQAEEIGYQLRDSGAKYFFCFEGTEDLPLGERGRAAFEASPECEHFTVLTQAEESDLGEPLMAALRDRPFDFATVPVDGDDVAVVLYTSGTTGKPKGAELTHLNMVMNTLVSDGMFPSGDRRDVFLGVLPLFHSFGQTTIMNLGFRRGATMVLQARFEPAEALELMRREQVTLFAGVPTMYWALLAAVRDGAEVPQGLEAAVSGGAALPAEILTDFHKAFGIGIQEGYGLSETSPVACFNRPGIEPKPGSIGVPIWGVEMRLIDGDWNDQPEVGEIAVRGHNVMRGYRANPEATAEALHEGWFRTGDIARRDPEGHYFIIDRAKDMIIRGGFNIYPRELEELLHTHPAVSLAAVVGIPHERHGEEIKAYVIREPGTTLTEAELITWCKERTASYKYPRLVEFRATLPMTATGKVLKRELRT